MIDAAILKDATTTGLAAVGAVLGVMNMNRPGNPGGSLV
jgi:hypothetical protein